MGNFSDSARQIILQSLENSEVNGSLEKGTLNNLEIYNTWIGSFSKKSSKIRILVLFEPEVVEPQLYRPQIQKYFDLIIPISPWRAKDLALDNWVFFPWDKEFSPVSPFKKRKEGIVVVNANKFSSSIHSNYGLRRRAVNTLQNYGIDYDLFGFDWEFTKTEEINARLVGLKKSILNFRPFSLRETFGSMLDPRVTPKGHNPNLLEILTNRDFNLVIENQSDYVSEKLFNSLLAGCIPIYVGPSLRVYLPEFVSCVFHLSSEQVTDGKHLTSILSDKEQIMEKKHNISRLLLNEKDSFKNFNSNNVWNKVSEIIVNFLSPKIPRV